MTVQPTSDETIPTSVAQALREDVGEGDLTAELISAETEAHARVSARESCIVCGTAWFAEVFRQLNDNVTVRWRSSDGEAIAQGTEVCRLRGPARALLTGERTALNFLQTLSATATAARSYVDAVAGTGATILDTRKTIPGLRDAQKYAVRCGGAQNHRHGLYDAILVKENHIAAAGGLTDAVAAARRSVPSAMLEVEVENFGQLKEALESGADRVLLDNFPLEEIRRAVQARDMRHGRRVALEASGGIDLDSVRGIAETVVDFISVGALTKHVIAVDFSMRFA